jgi:hypothetical protein
MKLSSLAVAGLACTLQSPALASAGREVCAELDKSRSIEGVAVLDGASFIEHIEQGDPDSKDEFENTEAFKKRVQKWRADNAFFAIKTTQPSYLDRKYNADTKILSADPSSPLCDRSSPCTMLDSHPRTNSTFYLSFANLDEKKINISIKAEPDLAREYKFGVGYEFVYVGEPTHPYVTERFFSTGGKLDMNFYGWGNLSCRLYVHSKSKKVVDIHHF